MIVRSVKQYLRVGLYAALLACTVGCSTVARNVIQGTDHGAAKAILPARPDYEVLALKTHDGISIVA